MKLDNIDLKIIGELQKSGRESASNIAEKTSEVVQCFSTTGNGSHTLLVTTKNSNTLEELLRKIQSWPGVTRTETQIILSSYKNGIVLPI